MVSSSRVLIPSCAIRCAIDNQQEGSEFRLARFVRLIYLQRSGVMGTSNLIQAISHRVSKRKAKSDDAFARRSSGGVLAPLPCSQRENVNI